MTAKLDPFLHPDFSGMFESNPLVIYDVGAAGSVYCPIETGPCERVRVYGFEPVKSSYDKLVSRYSKNNFVEFRQVALSDEDGNVTLNELGDGNETYSSLLTRESLGLHTDSKQVEGVRLDSVTERFGFPPADFIKLDTEGSEAMILAGGQKMLDRDVLGVFIEISFWRDDGEGVVFSEIDRILTQAGFILYDLQINRSHISTIGGKKDKVRTGDALYLRDFCHLAERITDTPVKHRRAKLLKLICLCVSWRYLNYALELIDYGRREGLVSSEEFSDLATMFVSTTDLAQRIPEFPGRKMIANFADVISYVLHRQAGKGIPLDFNRIGNSWVVARPGKHPDNIRIYKPIISDGNSLHIKTVDLGPALTDKKHNE